MSPDQRAQAKKELRFPSTSQGGYQIQSTVIGMLDYQRKTREELERVQRMTRIVNAVLGYMEAQKGPTEQKLLELEHREHAWRQKGHELAQQVKRTEEGLTDPAIFLAEDDPVLAEYLADENEPVYPVTAESPPVYRRRDALISRLKTQADVLFHSDEFPQTTQALDRWKTTLENLRYTLLEWEKDIACYMQLFQYFQRMF